MSHTLSMYLVKFINWMKAKGWSNRTIENYCSDLRFFLKYLRDQTTINYLTEIDKDLLNRYQTWVFQYRERHHYSVSSQHNKLVALRAFFKFLYDSGEMLFDPGTAIILPKKSKSLPKGVISIKEVIHLLEHVCVDTSLGLRDRAMLELLYSTGIRNSELRNLSIYDVDLRELKVSIRKGKNAKDRIVPLGEMAAEYIREYLLIVRPQLCKTNSNNEVRQVNGKSGPQRSADPLLFLSKSGKKITLANLVWIFKKYAKQAGFDKKITPHSLRHSCATHMLKNGADIRYIQEILGHASVATTQIYTKVETSDLKKIHRMFHPRERIYDVE